MSSQIIVHKNRRNVVAMNIGVDVSADTITSEIRAAAHQTAPLIATWVVTYATDGEDGEIVLTLDDSATAAIEDDRGFMDVKREVAGEPLAVFDQPLEVVFRGTVTQ